MFCEGFLYISSCKDFFYRDSEDVGALRSQPFFSKNALCLLRNITFQIMFLGILEFLVIL